MKRIDQYWYDDNTVSRLLLPLSWLFCLVAGIRRLGYRIGVIRRVTLPVPVIVVGNITVGGSGKTPLITWLAARLLEQGYRPGIISRGYGGQAQDWPQAVTADSASREVGDEPVLLARRTGCPIMVGPDRVEAGRQLLATNDVDLILSDDGLQHYRLRRSVEIAVVDAVRGVGNGHCLPAGPLRERPKRLKEVDLVVANGGDWPSAFTMHLEGRRVINLLDGREADLSEFAGRTIHAVAGIGNPDRFFSQLKAAGLCLVEHPFPDHHPLSAEELAFDDEVVLMTEKDAVKCRAFAQPSFWYLPVDAALSDGFGQRLFELLEKKHG